MDIWELLFVMKEASIKIDKKNDNIGIGGIKSNIKEPWSKAAIRQNKLKWQIQKNYMYCNMY